MEAQQIVDIVFGLLGGGLVTGIITHFLKKRKYNAEVTDTEAETDLKIGKGVQEVYGKMVNDVTAVFTKQIENMKQEQAERDDNCERRITAVKNEMDVKISALTEEIETVKNKCINNCFAKNYNR